MCLKKLENITGLNNLFSCKFAKDESKLPKYLRFKVKKNIYLWMKNLILIEVLMSVWDRLKLQLHENWIFFLEDKVLIGGGGNDRLAGQVAAVEVVGNQGGLGEEGDHLLHLQPSLFRRGRNGRGWIRGSRWRSQRADHVLPILSIEQLQRTKIYICDIIIRKKLTIITFSSVAIMFSMVWME